MMATLIYLAAVDYLEMPELLQGLQIDEATEEDAMYLSRKVGKEIPVKDIVVFVSEEKRYYVVASIVRILENDLAEEVLPIHAFLANEVIGIPDDNNLVKKIDFKDRKFKFWFYQVLPGEAIIRSTNTDLNIKYDKTIDIYLEDVGYVEMPWLLRGLRIDEATEEDAIYLNRKLGKEIPMEKIVVFVSEGKRYYVVASNIKIMENDLEHGVLPIRTFLVDKDNGL